MYKKYRNSYKERYEVYKIMKQNELYHLIHKEGIFKDKYTFKFIWYTLSILFLVPIRKPFIYLFWYLKDNYEFLNERLTLSIRPGQKDFIEQLDKFFVAEYMDYIHHSNIKEGYTYGEHTISIDVNGNQIRDLCNHQWLYVGGGLMWIDADQPERGGVKTPHIVGSHVFEMVFGYDDIVHEDSGRCTISEGEHEGHEFDTRNEEMFDEDEQFFTPFLYPHSNGAKFKSFWVAYYEPTPRKLKYNENDLTTHLEWNFEWFDLPLEIFELEGDQYSDEQSTEFDRTVTYTRLAYIRYPKTETIYKRDEKIRKKSRWFLVRFLLPYIIGIGSFIYYPEVLSFVFGELPFYVPMDLSDKYSYSRHERFMESFWEDYAEFEDDYGKVWAAIFYVGFIVICSFSLTSYSLKFTL